MKQQIKHLQLLVGVALCIIFAMSFTSCSKDEPVYEEEPYIYASTTEVEFEYTGNTIKTIWIYGNMTGYLLSPGADWLSKSYLEEGDLNIWPTENTSSSTRKGNLFLYNPNGGNTLTINVTQKGRTDSGSNSGNTGSGGNSGSSKPQLSSPTGVKVENIGSSNNPVVQITWNKVLNATIYRVIKTYPLDGGYEIEDKYCKTGVIADTSSEYVVDYDVKTGSVYRYQVMAAASGYESSNWSANVQIKL